MKILAALLGAIAICALAIAANLILLKWAVQWATPDFGPNQTAESVEARYQSCKSKAPEGWDCIMVPMLVSKDFVEQYND